VAELFWPQHELALDMVNALPSLLTSGFSAPQLAAKGPKIPVLSSRVAESTQQWRPWLVLFAVQIQACAE